MSFWSKLRTRKIAHASEGSRDILSDTTPTASTSHGNTFKTYDKQVSAISDRYNNTVAYGCALTRTIVDWRATQIAGNGINATATDSRTNEFIQDFIKENDLSGHRMWDWVRDSEMEGKSLLILQNINGTIEAKNLPWIRWNYTVNTSDNDAEKVESVSMIDSEGQDVTYNNKEFVYLKVAGATAGAKVYNTNQTPPKIASVLWHIDNIDKAMSDMRCNNHLFAFPKLVGEAKDSISANNLRALLFGKTAQGSTRASLETDRGEFYIIDGKMYYVEPSGQAVTSMTAEINTIAKIVSGATGMAVHHMGFVDLMSNRSTAEDLAELTHASTMHERESWKSGIKELLSKACNMQTEITGEIFDASTITVTLPVVMMSQTKQIGDVFLPLNQAGIVSTQTVRELLPNIDPELEQTRIDETESTKQNEALEMADLINANIAKKNEVQDENNTTM